MEFNEKLQQLRKQRALTQEQLAAAIFVSRTAVSKWESGRGLPEIGSLKALAAFFDVSVDDLLSSREALEIGEQDGKKKRERLCDLAYGLLDISMAMLLFLPLFRCVVTGVVSARSLLSLVGVSPWLRAVTVALVAASVILGILTLALQGAEAPLWRKAKRAISLGIGALAVLFFTVSLHPYAAVFVFFLLITKIVLLPKGR